MDSQYKYAFAYGRLRSIIDMAVYDLEHNRARDLIANELRRLMNQIESDLQDGIYRMGR